MALSTYECTGATKNAGVENAGADSKGGKCRSRLAVWLFRQLSMRYNSCIFHNRIFSAANIHFLFAKNGSKRKSNRRKSTSTMQLTTVHGFR